MLGDEDFAPTQRIILFVCVKQGALRRVFVRVFVFAVLSASPFFRIKNLNTITHIITSYTLFLTHLILHLITLNDADCKALMCQNSGCGCRFCLQCSIRQEEHIPCMSYEVLTHHRYLCFQFWFIYDGQWSSFQLKNYLSIVCLLPQLSPNFSLIPGQKAT